MGFPDFGSNYLNHPVIDQTGLKGAWDFDFRFSYRKVAVDGITVFEAVDKLGLSLEAGTAPRQAIAITSMADTPTPNPCGSTNCCRLRRCLRSKLPSFDPVRTNRKRRMQDSRAQIR